MGFSLLMYGKYLIKQSSGDSQKNLFIIHCVWMFVVSTPSNIKSIIHDYKDKGVVFLGGNKLSFNIRKKIYQFVMIILQLYWFKTLVFLS